MKVDKKKYFFTYIFPLLVLATVFICMLGYRRYIVSHGVFSIAKKTGISKGGKNGSSSEYEHRFANKSYYFSVIDHGGGARYVFIKILVDYPDNEIVLSGLKVPNCLQNDSMLEYTWKEMPACNQ